MTLHDLFTLTTIEHRHLLLAYVLVAVVQLVYFGLTIRGLLRPSDFIEAHEQKQNASSRRS